MVGASLQHATAKAQSSTLSVYYHVRRYTKKEQI